MADSKEFLDAVVKVKTLFSLARTVVARHHTNPLYIQAFMRVFFHTSRDQKIDCVLGCSMSLRFTNILHEMLQHLVLTRVEWTKVAVTLCNRQSHSIQGTNVTTCRILSIGFASGLLNADDLFDALVPNFSSFENQLLCRFVLRKMKTQPTPAQMLWVNDNLDDEIINIIMHPDAEAEEDVEEAEEEEIIAPPLRTAALMQLLAPFCVQIVSEFFKAATPDLLITLRGHYSQIFVFRSTLTGTWGFGLENCTAPVLHIRTDLAPHDGVAVDTPQRAATVIRQMLAGACYTQAKWLLQHVPFHAAVLMHEIDSHSNWSLELVGYDTGIPVAQTNIQHSANVSTLWRHVHDAGAAAVNIRVLPSLLLAGEQLTSREYARLSVWPVSLKDARMFALWEATKAARLLANPNHLCEHTWSIVCEYAGPTISGDISGLIAAREFLNQV